MARNVLRNLGAHMRSSGKIRVALIGFGQQKIISEDKLIRALTLLPDDHLVDLLCVKYDPWRNPKPAGCYNLSQKGIVIFKFRNEWDFHQLLYHEIAHHVFYNYLTIDERYRWVNEISRSERHVSSYARKNTHEDFAESYSQYVCGPMRVSGMPGEFRFINEVVFSGYIPNTRFLSLPLASP